MSGSVQKAKIALENIRHKIDIAENIPTSYVVKRLNALTEINSELCDVLTMLICESRDAAGRKVAK